MRRHLITLAVGFVCCFSSLAAVASSQEEADIAMEKKSTMKSDAHTEKLFALSAKSSAESEASDAPTAYTAYQMTLRIESDGGRLY